MKEYISQRLMVLILVLSGLGALIAAARWGLLDSQATAALVGGLIGSIKSLIDHGGNSDTTTKLPPAVTGGAVGAALALVLSCLVSSCTPTEAQMGARSLHMGADVCRAIAANAGRHDVETICDVAHDASEVLQAAIVPADAGE